MKSNLKNVFVLLISLLFFTAKAQNNKEALTAFSKSYEYEYAQNYAAAITTLTEVYNASSYEINLRLGWLNYLSAKYKESISFYQKAIALMPAATEPMWAIINPFLKLDSQNEIEKTYISILKLDPKNTVAAYNLGIIYYYKKNYVAAKTYFDISLNLYPFDYNNMLMSAWTNYFLGNKNQAISLFNKTLLYSPNDKSALEGLSLIK